MYLTIWINAFISNTPKNYTRIIPKGTYKEKLAILFPEVDLEMPIWPISGNTTITAKDIIVTTGKVLSTAVKASGARALNAEKFYPENSHPGYLTDQRTFSTDIDVSYRMQSVATVQLYPYTKLIEKAHKTSGTTEISMKTGEKLDYDEAVMTACSFQDNSQFKNLNPRSHKKKTFGFSTTDTTDGIRTFELRIVGKASDPLVRLSADIDYNGIFKIKILSPTSFAVQFSGYIDDFPSFECYAKFNGITKPLFTIVPPEGSTVFDLLGDANRKVKTAWIYFS